MRIILISILFVSIGSCNQPYNDVIDYGFKGKIKKVILTEYLNPVDSAGDWHAGKEPRFTKTSIFNDDGIAIEESFTIGGRSYTNKYDVKGDKKIGYSVIGDNSGNSKYYYNNSTLTEKHYDLDGSLDYETITFFDKMKLTIQEVYKGYSGESIKDYTTTYYPSRIDGYIDKYLIHDSINNIKTSYENIILKKDTNNNPIKILRIKDGSPEAIRVFEFEYN
jgi:hypothetical protein